MEGLCGQAETSSRDTAATWRPDGAQLLDAACGTGAHLRELRKWYVRCIGVRPFARHGECCSQKDHVEVEVGDIRDYIPEKTVDVLICLFSSIAHLFPPDLNKTFILRKILGSSLLNLGSLPILPKSGVVDLQTCHGDDLKLARACVSQVDDLKTIFDLHWLVTTRQGVEHFCRTP